MKRPVPSLAPGTLPVLHQVAAAGCVCAGVVPAQGGLEGVGRESEPPCASCAAVGADGRPSARDGDAAGRHGLSMLRRQYRDVQPHLHPSNALGLGLRRRGGAYSWMPTPYSGTYLRPPGTYMHTRCTETDRFALLLTQALGAA